MPTSSICALRSAPRRSRLPTSIPRERPAPTTPTARPGNPPAPASSTSNSKEAAMGTFGALNTAYRGLTAAQQGMNVAGQNIANAATEGYTRQRVQQSAIGAPAPGMFSIGTVQTGQGVSVDA